MPVALRLGSCGAERLAHAPEAEIEPGPRVRGAGRLQAVKIADGALEPDRRRMRGADGRETCRPGIRRVKTAISADGSSMQRHDAPRALSPQSPSSVGARVDQLASIARRQSSPLDDDARPRAMRVSAVAAAFGDVGQMTAMVIVAYPSSLATAWNQATSWRRQIDAGGEHEREMREHRHVGAFDLVRSARSARRRRCC